MLKGNWSWAELVSNYQPLYSVKKKKSGNGNASMINSTTIQMAKSFTILRLTGMIGMLNISFTKEELLKENRKLNRIRKK